MLHLGSMMDRLLSTKSVMNEFRLSAAGIILHQNKVLLISDPQYLIHK